MVSCDTAMSDLQKEATLKDNKIINSVIQELQDLSLHVVPDQLFSLLAKYQVPPEKQVKLLIQTATELQSRGGDVKEDKEEYTKYIKLSSIISNFVSEKYGNSAAASSNSSRKGRKAKDNAVTNMTSYFVDIVPTLESDDESKIPEPVVWSDSELAEVPITIVKKEEKIEADEVIEEKKEVDVATKEPKIEPKIEKISAEDALLEELLDDADENFGKDNIKEEIKEDIKTEPCCEEVAVKTKAKRGRKPAVTPAEKTDEDFKKWATTRPGRSTRARAPEVVCIDSSSSGDDVPIINEDAPLDTIEVKPAVKPARKKRAAPTKTSTAKRAKAAKKPIIEEPIIEDPIIEEPVDLDEEDLDEEDFEEDQYIPEAYEVVKSEEEDEDDDIPDLDDAESGDEEWKDDMSSSPTKERPVGAVRPTQRTQKKTPKAAPEEDDFDDIEGETVIVNFNKENIPTFENSYSHIVLADKPEPGVYSDDATTPTITEVLALSTCKIIRAPDMTLFELLQLVHGTEGQYLVATREEGKNKTYHLLIPGVISDTKLEKLKS